jgi:hypothetical protein
MKFKSSIRCKCWRDRWQLLPLHLGSCIHCSFLRQNLIDSCDYSWLTWLTKLLLQPFKELRHKKFLVNVINKAGIAGHFRHAVIIPLREQPGLLIRRFCIHCQQKLTTLVRAKKAILRSSNMVNKVNLPLLNYLSFGKYSLHVLKYEMKRIQHCK